MPEVHPQPNAFNNATQVLAWVRKKARQIHEAGGTPVAVTIPTWAECLLAAMKREEVGDEALTIMRSGARGSFATLYGIPTTWDAEYLDVTVAP